MMVAKLMTGFDSLGLAVPSLPLVEIEAPRNGLILPLFDREAGKRRLSRGWC